MHNECQAALPMYVAGTLADAERRAIERHLHGCALCQAEARMWQDVAAAIRQQAAARVNQLPPLSPMVTANLGPRSGMGRALQTAARLIWLQWTVLRGLLSVTLLILVLGIAGTLALRDDTQTAFPLLALAPIVAALTLSSLHHTDADPAWEIVAATPTAPGTLIFARLTLVLSLVVGVMLTGSVALSALSGETLGPMVAVWLGPLLLLSALATVLAVRWSPVLAAGVSLGIWGSVVATLLGELRGATLPGISLRPMLDPGWLLVSGQLAGAALLWWLAWHLVNRQAMEFAQ